MDMVMVMVMVMVMGYHVEWVLKVVRIPVGREVRVLFSGACQELGNEILKDPPSSQWAMRLDLSTGHRCKLLDGLSLSQEIDISVHQNILAVERQNSPS